MTTYAIEAARERQLDWLLDEAIAGPRRANAGGARASRTTSPRRWLAAAVAVLAAGAAIGVALQRDRDGDRADVAAPPQDPVPTIDWRECPSPGALDDVPADVVNLRCFDFDDAALARLARLDKLERLDLSGMKPDARGVSRMVPITDAGVSALGALTNLRWLSLAGCQLVNGRTLDALRAVPRLEHLDLSGTSVRSEGLAHLPSLPSLRSLDLSRCLDFHGRSLADVAKVPGLRRLELDDCATVAATDVMQLAKLRELRHLSLRHCMGAFRGQTAALSDVTGEPASAPPKQDRVGVTDAAIAALADLPLEVLDLRGCWNLTDDIAAPLGRMASLREVDLGELRKTTGALLDALPDDLRALSLFDDRHYPVDAIRSVARFGQLQVLDLGGLPQLDDATLRAVIGRLRLRELRLGGQPIMGDARGPDGAHRPALTPAIADALEKQQHLETLHASYASWIDSRCARSLARLPRLRRLECGSARLDEATCAALAASGSLRELDAHWAVGLTVEAVLTLQPLGLRELSIYGTRIPSAELREALARWPGLTARLPDGTSLTTD